MAHTIVSVESGSIAQKLGILAGDVLEEINGELVVDFIDYQALCAEEKMCLVIRRGEEETSYTFEKDEYEPLGLEFFPADDVFDAAVLQPMRVLLCGSIARACAAFSAREGRRLAHEPDDGQLCDPDQCFRRGIGKDHSPPCLAAVYFGPLHGS